MRARGSRTRIVAAALGCVAILAASTVPAEARQGSGSVADGISVPAASYLAHALGLIRANYYLHEEIDWQAAYERAFREAAGAEVPADTYQAIRDVLASLSHSFLQMSDELVEIEAERRRARGLAPLPEPPPWDPGSVFASRRTPEVIRHVEGDRLVGHLVVPSVGGGERATRYAQTLQSGIAELDAEGACGWIVDVRGNPGGNMWPMLVGVGPVLGEGLVGGIKLPGRSGGSWFYRDGVSGTEGAEGFIGARLPGPAVRLATAPPVAVLIDGGTGSSGEAVAVAFKGRPDTRFFGQPTSGYATATEGFRMPDGLNLVVAVGVDVDRDGVEYPTVVAPDVLVPSPAAEGDPDEQLATALAWLATRSCER